MLAWKALIPTLLAYALQSIFVAPLSPRPLVIYLSFCFLLRRVVSLNIALIFNETSRNLDAMSGR